jgi:hypothetical protein
LAVVLVEALLGKTDFLAAQAGVADKTEPPLAAQAQPGKEIMAATVIMMRMADSAVVVAAVQALLVRLVTQVSKGLRAVMV